MVTSGFSGRTIENNNATGDLQSEKNNINLVNKIILGDNDKNYSETMSMQTTTEE